MWTKIITVSRKNKRLSVYSLREYLQEETGGEGMSETITTTTGKVIDKITRYGWKIKDKQGDFKKVDKEILLIDPTYQRAANSEKVLKIAQEWSWISCNTIEVAYRDNNYYVIDGQHRVLGALKRSDIKELPCMIFETTDVAEEAIGFLSTNTSRRPVATVDIFRAKIVAKDDEALYILRVFNQNGIVLSKTAGKPKGIKSVAACFTMARENREHFERAMSLAAELCADCLIHEKIISGLFQLSKRLNVPLTNAKLRARILSIGNSKLMVAANKAGAFYERGGGLIWAYGMYRVINSNLRQHAYTMELPKDFQLRGEE